MVQHVLAVAGVPVEIVKRQRAWPVVDVINGVVEGLVGHHQHQRAEDFVLGDLHVVGDIEHQGVGNLAAAVQVLVCRVDGDHLGALFPGVVQVAVEPAVLALVDDAGEVRVVA